MLTPFHPVVAAWFEARFGAPTACQAQGWPHLLAGRDALIAAPTGSGKTLAAFLACLDRLLREAAAGQLADRTRVLYVSPLKALSNDVRKNLEEPLAELRARFAAAGLGEPSVRTAVRTGDTPPAERARAARTPPHVLITTPESLYVLLGSAGGRRMLSTVETVIVDEIHAVAASKRGAHLSLSLERLEALCPARPQRIGLSATQRPIEEIARFLVGAGRVTARAKADADTDAVIDAVTDADTDAVTESVTAPDPLAGGTPDCAIVDLGHSRKIDLRVLVPRDELSAVASKEQWGEVLDQIAQLCAAHRSTLVFVNTRKQSERVCALLEQRLGPGTVAAHHGSLSRETRLVAEEQLKSGALRAVVATASLELGIDVGAIDLVVQLESPRAFAVALQRIGRAGHTLVGVPKGRLFPLSRDQLAECAALARGLLGGALEVTRIPEAPLDILAQQLVAEVAGAGHAEEKEQGDLDDASAGHGSSEEALFALVRRAWGYRRLPRTAFDAVVEMHALGAPRRSVQQSGARLHRDLVQGTLRARRGSRLAALTSGGAIPDSGQYAVIAEPEGLTIGSLDEDFAIESMAGDVIQLGNRSWRIRRVERQSVRVEDAQGAPPSIPFWNGEAPGRSAELSQEVSRLRADLEPLLDTPEAAAALLLRECALDGAGAEQLVAYLRASRAALGALPTQGRLIAERFFDEAGGMQLIVHSPFGARLNRAFGLSLRKKFCRTFDFELQAAANDDAILLSLGPQHSFPLDSVFGFLHPQSVEEALTQAVLRAPMFQVRWRWNAARSLAILRYRGGKKTPLPLLRMQSDDLLAAVFPAQAQCQEHAAGVIEPPDHPLVQETLRDCLHEAMDLTGLTALLERMLAGGVELLARDTAEPSPLAHEILGAHPYTYLDDAPLEERRARMVQVRRTLSPEDAAHLGALDAAAIAQVAGEAWPEARDADEACDALSLLGLLPASDAPPAWRPLLAKLIAQGRAVQLLPRGGLVAVERVPRVRGALAGAEEAGIDSIVDIASTADIAESADSIDINGAVGIAGAAGHGAAAGSEQPIPLDRFSPAPRHASALLAPEEPEQARAELLRGWLACTGPCTTAGLAERLGLTAPSVELALCRLESEGVVLRGRFSPGAPGTEWCDRTLLARIHRLTLGRLQRELEPVTAAELLRFLTRWQHALPGAQLHGPRGAAEVVGQLQGFHAAAAAWEPGLLATRLRGDAAALTDQLCLSGEVAWGRLVPGKLSDEPGAAAPAAHRSTPITLARREDLPWLLDALAGEDGGSAEPIATPAARRVLALLKDRGALFVHELRGLAGLRPSELDDALWELAARGLCSSDGYSAVRARLDPRAAPHAAAGRWSLLRPRSEALFAEPEADEAGPGEGSEPASIGDGAGARGAVGVDARGGRTLALAPFGARPGWLEPLARQYLRRWGVVFRDLLAREPRCPPWRELLLIYRKLEARGELRGGRFVQGFSGEQFVLPEALETLRALRRTPPGAGERVEVSACDPLNLAGILTPGPRVPAQAGTRVVILDGVPQPVAGALGGLAG